jgi:hypothetical protein
MPDEARKVVLYLILGVSLMLAWVDCERENSQPLDRHHGTPTFQSR